MKRKFETAGERRYAGRHLHGLLPAGETIPDSWDYFLPNPAFSKNAGMLYFGALDGQLTAVDLNTRKAAWVFQNDTSKQNLPAVQNADGTLNFGAIMLQNFYDDMVIAVSELLSIGSILSWPVVVKDVTYVGSTDGNLYALD